MKFRYLNVDIKDLKNYSDQKINFLNHDIQRNFFWDKKRQNLLISTLLEELPMPSIIIFSDFVKDEKEFNFDNFKDLKVLDGKQRLSSIIDFINNKIVFKNNDNSSNLKKYEGKKFSEFDYDDQTLLLNTKINVCLIYKDDNYSDENENLFKIFKRLNTGGVNLNSQEVRMCIFPSKLTKFLANCKNFNFYDAMFGSGHKLFTDKQENRMKLLEFLTYLIKMYESENFEISEGSSTNLNKYYEDFYNGFSFKKLNDKNHIRNFISYLDSFIPSYNLALNELKNKAMDSPIYFYSVFNLYLTNIIINKNMTTLELKEKIKNILVIKELDNQLIRKHPTSKNTRLEILDIIFNNKNIQNKKILKEENRYEFT